MSIKPKRKVTPEEDAALRARADTLAECAALAWTFEQEQANLGFVRMILENRAKEAADLVDTLVPLGGAGVHGQSGDMASPPPAPPSGDGYHTMVAKAFDAALDAVDPGRHSVHHKHWRLHAVEDEEDE